MTSEFLTGAVAAATISGLAFLAAWRHRHLRSVGRSASFSSRASELVHCPVRLSPPRSWRRRATRSLASWPRRSPASVSWSGHRSRTLSGSGPGGRSAARYKNNSTTTIHRRTGRYLPSAGDPVRGGVCQAGAPPGFHGHRPLTLLDTRRLLPGEADVEVVPLARLQVRGLDDDGHGRDVHRLSG